MISVSSRLDLRTQSLIDPIHHLGQVPDEGMVRAELLCLALLRHKLFFLANAFGICTSDLMGGVG